MVWTASANNVGLLGIAGFCHAVPRKCTSPPLSTLFHMSVFRGRAHSSLAYSSPSFPGPTYVGVYVAIYICTYICYYVCSSETGTGTFWTRRLKRILLGGTSKLHHVCLALQWTWKKSRWWIFSLPRGPGISHLCMCVPCIVCLFAERYAEEREQLTE